MNLKYITVTWLFKIAKSLWVIFNSFCGLSCLYLVCIHPHLDLKVYQLYEFPVCTIWQGGIERWQLMSNTCLIYCCGFSWYQHKFLWHEQREIWFYTQDLINFLIHLKWWKRQCMSEKINEAPDFKTKFIWVSYPKKNLQHLKCGHLLSLAVYCYSSLSLNLYLKQSSVFKSRASWGQCKDKKTLKNKRTFFLFLNKLQKVAIYLLIPLIKTRERFIDSSMSFLYIGYDIFPSIALHTT